MKSGRMGYGAVSLALLCAAIWAHRQVPLIATGDGFAVYFPVVWDLEDGKGLSALDPLAYCCFRMPGYSLSLYLASRVLGGLAQAVTAVALLSVAVVLFAGHRLSRPEERWSAAFAVALFFGSSCALHMLTVSTPDLACLALLLAAIALALDDRLPDARWLGAGLFGAASLLFRINALWVVPFFALALALDPMAKKLRPSVALLVGLLLPLSAWSAVSLAHGQGWFWIPTGSAAVEARVFHPDILPEGSSLAAYAAEHPLALLGRFLLRATITGPLELLRHAAGPLPSVLALFGLWPVWKATPARSRVLLGALAILSWLPMVAANFEPRYFPIQVGLVCVLAGRALSMGLERLGAQRPFVLCAIVAGVLLLIRVPALERTLSGQRTGAEFVRATAKLEERSTEWPGGCIGMDRIGYKLIPFRYLSRQRGLDRACCCGPGPEQVGFLEVVGRGELRPAASPERYERVDVEGAPEALVLYKVRTGSTAQSSRTNTRKAPLTP